jgi:hypothetical protein
VADRWSGTAFKTINGEFLVVFTAEHVQLLPGVRVRLHDGGVQGRGWQRDQT